MSVPLLSYCKMKAFKNTDYLYWLLKNKSILIIDGFHISEFAYLLKFICNPKVNNHSAFGALVDVTRAPKICVA